MVFGNWLLIMSKYGFDMIRSMSKLSMFLTPYENLPLSFESGGYISRKYRGRIVIKLTNYSTNSIKLHSGTIVGYIVMQPFSME